MRPKALIMKMKKELSKRTKSKRNGEEPQPILSNNFSHDLNLRILKKLNK